MLFAFETDSLLRRYTNYRHLHHHHPQGSESFHMCRDISDTFVSTALLHSQLNQKFQKFLVIHPMRFYDLPEIKRVLLLLY